MSLLVLFRTRLEWCNYACGYCPWNAEVRKLPAEAFRDDERRLTRVVDRVAELLRPVEFFITPKGTVAGANAHGFDNEVANCVAGVVGAIEFPAPKGGGGVQVNYPLTFHAAGQ